MRLGGPAEEGRGGGDGLLRRSDSCSSALTRWIDGGARRGGNRVAVGGGTGRLAGATGRPGGNGGAELGAGVGRPGGGGAAAAGAGAGRPGGGGGAAARGAGRPGGGGGLAGLDRAGGAGGAGTPFDGDSRFGIEGGLPKFKGFAVDVSIIEQ